jgi:ornithine carbamoyltransferase
MFPRHFLTLMDLSAAELQTLMVRAIELKTMLRQGICYEPLKNRTLAMVFEKSSTRTRVSFETAMTQLGGNAIFLSPQDTQLGRGEPIEDMARVLSGMIDGIMVRTFAHANVERFAQYATIPVINGLTDEHHPCQLLADLLTFIELRGSIQGKKVAWIGDGNNVCQSYIQAAYLFDFQLAIATPPGYEPQTQLITDTRITLSHDPNIAIKQADLISTDVWASMGQEAEQAIRLEIFKPYQVNTQLMAQAQPNALFMHCLPAHRGEEVSAAVIDGPQSVVWQQAENRLHTQKALLEFLLINCKKNTVL